jgi:hypothetical protein
MTDRAGRSELHHAALEGNVQRITEVLDQGADVNATDTAGCSPLHFATQDYRVDVVATLIASGAEIDAQNRFGATPLSVAVFNPWAVARRSSSCPTPAQTRTAATARASARVPARFVAPGLRHQSVMSATRGRGNPKGPQPSGPVLRRRLQRAR